MAIYRLIASNSFGPDEIEPMTTAYEAALVELRLTDRQHPLTEDIAKAIIAVTATGDRDPVRIKERALHALGLSQPDSSRASSELTAKTRATASPGRSPPPARCPIPGRD
jgi:hypothetical protein